MDFTSLLLDWYNKKQRDLPWKKNKDPYSVWVSEVILQQTRVEQGTHYYKRFLEAFPTIHHLAQAQEDEVLKLWQGLGYYSRARNMHKTAKRLMEEHNGTFPADVSLLRSLHGIGDYTAAAVASFAFGLPVVALDGNGYRILARVFGIDLEVGTTRAKKVFSELAESLLPTDNSASFNQALMDFGSLVCTPRPVCSLCPMTNTCLAYQKGLTDKLPVKQEKNVSRLRYFNYLDIELGKTTYLRQRAGKDIWKGLYEFPLIETPQRTGFPELEKTEQFVKLFGSSTLTMIGTHDASPHKLTHQIIYPVFYKIKLSRPAPGLEKEYLRIDRKDIHRYAISRLTEKYLNFFHNFAAL
ncbi:MAG: A/G-specific adenine glycosylase [Bacteroidales bacterium]|jgi:A/G-specific adenine glycosylase|nr:A/G-specific adenine glycosylase [Bacteroidales bacterium]NLH24619.1 A/G-specific adenine glycosylase [Bacteroidales bacterium]HPJ82659.1 A/G-specific adenine glycosylase [Bacteroidales bacterium]